MDFLDPKKERQNQLKLLLGYALVTIAIAGATLVLLYQAKGYELNKQGQVTQNGLLFISSQPAGSNVYLNNHFYTTTGARVIAPAGAYILKITRTGYHDWTRPIYIAGGDVQHFDYPFLFPKTLKTTQVSDLSATPTLYTQSLDQRWLLLDRPGSPGTFTLYDLNNPKQPTSSIITLPSSVYTASDGAESWSLEEWANDNRNVVLEHTYTSKGATEHEYILVDTQSPSNSVNLTYTLNLNQDEVLSLFNNQAAQVYVYNPDDQSLQRINVSDGSVVSKLDHVIAYKTFSNSMVLYVSDQAPDGKVTPGEDSVILLDGQKSYTLRTLPSGAPSYVLNLAQYAGDWYVAVGASNGPSVYVYKDPQNETPVSSDAYPDPWRRFALADPTYLSFSDNTQFLMAESGQRFVVYDLENNIQYEYTATQPLDQPQLHATWMDGDRLMYVSNGKLVVFDYDYENQQTLMPASSGYLADFDGGYSYVFALASEPVTAKDPTPGLELTSTSLLTPADQ